MSLRMTPPAPAAAATVGASGRCTRRGRTRLIVAGSLLTGAVLAVVLPLLVFAGTTESAVTGSSLLGFAICWAMLAVHSILLTHQPPQRARNSVRAPPARPATAVGLDSGRRPGCHRAGAPDRCAGRPGADRGRLGLASAAAGAGGVDRDARAPLDERRPLAALPRRRRHGRRGRRG